MPLKIVVCPTIREPNGLALSSRNQYLTKRQKKDAANIYQSLRTCRKLIEAGTTDTRQIIAEMQKTLQGIPSVEIEYISIVDAETLESIEKIAGKVLATVAVRIGTTRLIDNIVIDISRKLI